jgi:hypothetical protein
MFEGAGKVARGPFTKVQDPGRGVIPADAVDESTSIETLVFVIEDGLLHLVDGHREVSVLHHRVREEEIIRTRGRRHLIRCPQLRPDDALRAVEVAGGSRTILARPLFAGPPGRRGVRR